MSIDNKKILGQCTVCGDEHGIPGLPCEVCGGQVVAFEEEKVADDEVAGKYNPDLLADDPTEDLEATDPATPSLSLEELAEKELTEESDDETL